MIAPSGFDRVRRGIDAANAAGIQTLGEVGRHRPGAAADVEQVQPRPQVRKQIGCGVLNGSPAVGAEHALVVAMRI